MAVEFLAQLLLLFRAEDGQKAVDALLLPLVRLPLAFRGELSDLSPLLLRGADEPEHLRVPKHLVARGREDNSLVRGQLLGRDDLGDLPRRDSRALRQPHGYFPTDLSPFGMFLRPHLVQSRFRIGSSIVRFVLGRYFPQFLDLLGG